MSKNLEQALIYSKLKKYDNADKIANEDFSHKLESLEAIIRLSRENQGFEYYTPICSQKRFIGRFVLAYKRLVRKSVAFIFAPILESQTTKNKRFVQALHEVSVLVKDMQSQYTEQNDLLQKEIELLRNELEKEKEARALLEAESRRN